MDKETAETCNYSVPRAGKEISGASVYLARIIVQQYTNLRVESRVTGADRTQVHAESVCFDLQNNTAVKSTTSRPITYKGGGRYNEDLIVLHGKVAAAIAFRNAVFDVVPKSVVNKVYNAAINLITGDLSTEEKLIKRRIAAIDTFKDDYGVLEKELLTYLGINTINQIKKDEIIRMLGMFNSLKSGEYTVEGMFERKVKPETKQITVKEFLKLLEDLKKFEISKSAALQKYKDSGLTDKQKGQIETAGTIDDKRLTEITELVIAEKKELNYFEFYLDDVQMETLKNAVADNALKDEK